LMTVMLTASPAQTLLLRRPPLLAPVAAVALAITLNPAINLLRSVIMRVYPLTDELTDALTRLESGLTDNMGLAFLAIAVLPALCEELAFRGFILSGFRRLGHKWTAIGLTSILFGATHAIFQQSLVACIVGVVIGFIAIQTGSLLPGILFHLVNNSLALVIKMASPALADERHWLHWLVRAEADDGQLYHWPVILLGLAASGLLLYWFHKLPYSRTPEESLQEAIERQQAQWLPG
jgi:sodium transport system permease protein